MQGRQEYHPKIYYQVSLDALVPSQNFYRRLTEVLDLNFLYPATAKYYGSEGQSSIDPLVFFKILLVGYLNNINSDRKLIEYCSNCLDVRLFLKYDLDQELPWHSTISRTRQLYGEQVFLSLFQQVLGMCVQKGMVRGKRQAIDSAFIKANASMDSLLEKQVIEDGIVYANELDLGSEFQVSSSKKKLVEQHHDWKKEAYKDMPGNVKTAQIDEDGHEIRPKFLSNHTHYSPTDPDAKISVKPGKARQLNYAGQLAVGDAHHVITGACASTSGSKDSEILPEILDQTMANLAQNDMTIEQIAADAGYSSGKALAYCEEKGIDAYIPNFGQYKPERAGFVFNEQKDQYECVQAGGAGAILSFKGIKTDARGYESKHYRSSELVCKDCPLRETCCGKSTKFKKLVESVYKPYYDRMHEKLEANRVYTNRIVKRRSATVEPVLGTLINFHNMKRVNTRGMEGANKHVLMAALSYNLKKMMKFMRKKVVPKVQEMSQMIEGLKSLQNALFRTHLLHL